MAVRGNEGDGRGVTEGKREGDGGVVVGEVKERRGGGKIVGTVTYSNPRGGGGA